MKNISSFLQEIEADSIKNNTIVKTQLLLDEINYVLLKIKLCKNQKEANPFFDILEQIHFMLSKLQHKYGLDLSPSLNQFVVDFDLLYDPDERNRLFNLIKNNDPFYAINYEAIFLKCLQEIEKDPVKININYKLDFLYQAINSLLFKIKSGNSLKDADKYFELLAQANDVISRLINIHDIKVSSQLRKFYKDFDRIDDQEWREYLFYKIKNENYSLEGKPTLDM